MSELGKLNDGDEEHISISSCVVSNFSVPVEGSKAR